ncbi:hypothetical protein PInf_018065 [Phytophthora infestans]|nr:hypothetical protein PInf_018065 [Phytophthora infestans]
MSYRKFMTAELQLTAVSSVWNAFGAMCRCSDKHHEKFSENSRREANDAGAWCLTCFCGAHAVRICGSHVALSLERSVGDSGASQGRKGNVQPRHFSAAEARWPIPQHSSTTASLTNNPQPVTMGVQPQLNLPRMQEQVTKVRTGSPVGKHHVSRWHRHHEAPVPVEALPEEAQQLKEMILRTHKVKHTRFSLSHMKKRVVPPVDIPREMNSHRALSTTVAGRSVPLTRCMWDNTKRRTHHMEQISESYALHCTLFR